MRHPSVRLNGSAKVRNARQCLSLISAWRQGRPWTGAVAESGRILTRVFAAVQPAQTLGSVVGQKPTGCDAREVESWPKAEWPLLYRGLSQWAQANFRRHASDGSGGLGSDVQR